MRRQRGFTVVELMVAVAVIFLLAAIAIPSYQRYLQTARESALLSKVDSFRMYIDNYRIDNGTYMEGTYDPGAGVNDFAGPMGFRVDNDDSGIAFTVEPGACGNIANCYQVVAVDQHGNRLTWRPDGWEYDTVVP